MENLRNPCPVGTSALASHASIFAGSKPARASIAPPSLNALSIARRRSAASGQRARIVIRAFLSALARSPNVDGNRVSSLCRTALARPADAPPVPMAISTGSRSRIEGSVKSHRSGRSTALTRMPRAFSLATIASAPSSTATMASAAISSSPTITAPARSSKRRLASAPSPEPIRMTARPARRTKMGRLCIALTLRTLLVSGKGGAQHKTTAVRVRFIFPRLSFVVGVIFLQKEYGKCGYS